MNNETKKWSLLLLSLTLALGLSACSKNDDSNNSSAAGSSAPSASAPSSSAAGPSASSAAPSASASAVASPSASTMPVNNAELPAEKTFTLKLEGNEEQQTAKLAKGNGYALYVFDAFTFDADAGKLYMNVDKNYYVEITKLPSSFNADQIKKDSEKELSKLGKVREMSKDEQNPLIGDTAFFLLANNDKLTNEFILKEVDGAGYLFKVNMPQTEANEGFGPHAFVSVSSIANQ